MMEHFNYLAFAIPAFFVFLFLEYQVAIKRNMASVFKYESSVSNLSIGIAERLLNLFISASFYNLFFWVYKHHAIFNISNQWWVWIALILVTDLIWYWYSTAYRFKFKGYLNAQILVCVALLTLITGFYTVLHPADKLFMVSFVLLTLINCGALMEQRKWIFNLECFRLLVTMVYFFWSFGYIELLLPLVIFLIIAEQVFRFSRLYRNYVLRYDEF